MKELTVGDDDNVAEIKGWLKKGMKASEAERRLRELGFNSYHISVLLEEATGRKLVPGKPVVDTMRGLMLRVAGVIIMALVAAAVVWWYFIR